MSRNTHDDEPHQSDGSDIAEVTQLCHEYSTEREDLHKLGFQCLLKKLKEIEKIILAISKMSGSVRINSIYFIYFHLEARKIFLLEIFRYKSIECICFKNVGL